MAPRLRRAGQDAGFSAGPLEQPKLLLLAGHQGNTSDRHGDQGQGTGLGDRVEATGGKCSRAGGGEKCGDGADG